MSQPAGQPKRHRGNRLGERRTKGDGDSSNYASEEDNDASDVGSLMSVHAPNSAIHTATSSPKTSTSSNHTMHPSAGINTSSVLPPGQRKPSRSRMEALSGEGSQSEGLDSPTYDGDVESSSTIGGTPIHASHHQMSHHIRRTTSPTPGALGLSAQPSNTLTISPHGSQRLPTPKASQANLVDMSPPSSPELAPYRVPTDVPVHRSNSLAEPTKSQTLPLSAKPSMSHLGPPRMTTRPVELPVEDIRGFVERAIHGEGSQDGVERWWKTNPPPEGKVVRVYADGVYDLFHFGHALQLRQAKLSFPRVHLLVGVCSDELCASHKSAPAMTHAERCESVRHCRWADEVLPDAPWVVDQAWLDKYDIGYIAHDELVYPSREHDDVYAFAKEQGRFVPTRRTPAISTSDLLERIVRGYRDGFFDSKLEKNGHPELLAADVDWDSSASVEKRERRAARTKKAQANISIA